MKLFCKDETGKLRVVDTGDFDVDLDKQRQIKDWLGLDANIRVKSPVLTCYTTQPIVLEPEVA